MIVGALRALFPVCRLEVSRVCEDWHHLDRVSCHDLGHEGRLVDDVASLELLEALATGGEALLKGHVMLVVLVEDGVDEVASVAVGALCDLLECAQVVHPVELGLLLDLVVSAHKDVDIEGSARPERRGHL